MPYINEDDRMRFTNTPESGHYAKNCGELTYLLYKNAVSYWNNENSAQNYAKLSEIIAAFENAKFEFQRRYVAPYEDVKLLDNGDV